MSPYLPTIQVQAAFGYGALNASPVWTTIDTSTMSASIHRGRSTEFDQFQAATASLKLRDTTRLFDPLNTAGAYAGSLLPNVPVKVTATVAGTVYPRFYGYVDGWMLDPRRRVEFAEVKATDGFKILAQKKLPQSVYETVVLADTPWVYWKVGAATGSTAVDSSGNRNDGEFLVSNTVTRGAPAVVSYANEGSVGLTANDWAPVRSQSSTARILTFPKTYEVWIRADATKFAAPNTYYLFVQGGADPDGVDIRYLVGAGGNTVWVRSEGTSPAAWAFDLPTLHDGYAHHLVAVITTTTVTLYVDGAAVSGISGAGGVNDASTLLYAGIPSGGIVAPSATEFTWQGTQDDIAYYTTALSATQVSTHYTAATTPWDGDLTGARIGRILDQIGWPAGLRDIDPGEVVLGPADLAGMNALAYLQLIAASEQGRLFMSGDGKVTFHDAARVRANSATVATFSDDGADNPYLYGSLKYSKDLRAVYNDASIQRKYGLAQTASNAASIGTYGPRTRSLTGLLMQTDAQARALADQIVYRYKDAQTRVDSWTVNPQVKSSTWQQTLAVKVGDHVTVEVTPLSTGSQSVLQLDAESISESITPAKYEMTFTGSPRDPNLANYFTWGGTLTTQFWGTGTWA